MLRVDSSAQKWRPAATRMFLALVVLQFLGPGAGWPQEPAQPRIEVEFAKQEKIYSSRGDDVPGGYVTGRALSDYAELLPSGFCDKLGRLGGSDRWLDIGAGDGQAILDYYSPKNDGAPPENCIRSWSKARAVAMSIEDRRTEAWRHQAAIFGHDRLRYLSGKRLRQYTGEELGKFQIITDVYGGFSYTEDLSRFLEKVLSLLDMGGVFYTMVQSAGLENGKHKPDTYSYLTELVDASGRDVKVCSWLKKTACVKVACESKSEWDAPTELINVQKVCSEVSVPPLTLLEYQAGAPPGRRFEVVPGADDTGLALGARDKDEPGPLMK